MGRRCKPAALSGAAIWRYLGQRALPWVVPVGLIALWQVASALGWLSTRVLPAPSEVIKVAWALTVSGELWTHVKVSAWRALAGLAIGGGLGLALGLLTESVKFFETLLDSTLQMVRNIPALALIPLVILWFGIDESAKLFLIAVSMFFPIYINTFHGIRNVDPGLIEMGRTYGLSRWQLYREVILPGAMSSILVGLRFALGLMWVILIVAETISAQAGWLPDHECAGVFADRCGAGGNPALCLAGQAGRRVCAGPGALLAALAPGLSSCRNLRKTHEHD
jgi:sulfonate transport system permease protein